MTTSRFERLGVGLNEADGEWVTAAQDGDRDAFARLIERHRGRVYAAAISITNDHHEATEITQETFVRALQALPRLKDPNKVGPWLRGIAHTIAQDIRRRAARERRHLQQVAQERSMTVDAADQGLAAHEHDAKEVRMLSQLVATLPERTRVALDLRFREGLSYAEIGDAMGVPASTVRGLLYRGTRTLRKKLKSEVER